MRKLAALLPVAVAVLALAGDALAAEIVRRDGQGRPIRLDVRADDVDADWYASLLRRAAHADEISTVTIRIASRDDVASLCGRRAGGCYRGRRGGGTVVVPAGRSSDVAHTLLHEYAHHIDRSHDHGGVEEPNGTRSWWRARGMAQLVAQRSVTRSYRLGWSRSIAEIFAEDYAHTELHAAQLRARYAIPWLEPPDEAVRRAIFADLGRGTPPATVRPPVLRPVVIDRAGRLSPRGRISIPFGLLGPGRQVTFSAAVSGATARLELACRRPVASRTVAPSQGRVSLDIRNLGPGECRATLVATGSDSIGYSARLRLAIGRP